MAVLETFHISGKGVLASVWDEDEDESLRRIHTMTETGIARIFITRASNVATTVGWRLRIGAHTVFQFGGHSSTAFDGDLIEEIWWTLGQVSAGDEIYMQVYNRGAYTCAGIINIL